ncbi:MAG: hypothetical protein L3J07_04015 [Candidatus Magasanikbacteria bacterium]|nr:hypothetical protein [Candidatus Magasanikbacteria bacterium]
MIKFFKKLVLTFFIFLFTFVFSGFSVVLADTETGVVSVNANYAGGEEDTVVIPDPPDPPVDTASPIISSVSVSALDIFATVSWSATDDVGVLYCDFEYGLSSSYGTTASATGVGGNYSSNLTSLLPGTLYFFKITCADLAGNSSVSTDIFSTRENEPPVISSVSVVSDLTTADVSWSAVDNVLVDSCSFGYDLDDSLEPFDLSASAFNVGGQYYESSFGNLLPNTRYYYKISCIDPSGNTVSHISSFETLSDTTPPPDISNFSAVGADRQIQLNWDYTVSLSDFDYFMVRRGLSPVSNITQGVEIMRISNPNSVSLLNTGRTNLTEYFYTIFVFDTSGNYSAGVSASAIPHLDSEVNFCTDSLDNDLDGTTDCADIDCALEPVCISGVEICTDGIDNDNDGFTDCADLECISEPSCALGVEICTDGIDNDNDGAVDCSDLDCSSNSACIALGPACDDGLDNDGDGLVDLQDPGCENKNDTEEYNPPADTVGSGEQLPQSSLFFWLSERTIDTTLIGGVLSALSGDHTTIGISESALALKDVDNIDLKVAGNSYNFNFDSSDGWYYSDFVTPQIGVYSAYVEIEFSDGTFDSSSFELNSLPYGVVRDNISREILIDASVTLLDMDTGEQVWASSNYRQVNPQSTSAGGAYAFIVPPGQYKVVAQRDGYRPKETLSFVVANRIVNRNLTLIKKPKPLIDVIDPDAPVLENIKNVAENLNDKFIEQSRVLSEFFGEAVLKVEQLADDPEIEVLTKTIVAPSVIGVSAAAVIPSLWTTAIPLFRFIFFQPVLLFWRRKRKKWGVVYNALTKLPVDLATVRLLDAKTNKIIQSRVTDREGRFLFIADPGEYLMQISKSGFKFPSSLLKGKKEDGEFFDVYHGESIKVTEEDTVITPSIPIEFSGKKEHIPWKIVWRGRLVFLQHAISLLGVLGTALALYITPEWYIGVFLVIQIGLYVGFNRFIKPKEPTGWGIVSEKSNKKPIGKAVARLFSKKFNKLIETRITDTKGRYAFLVGPSDYYVTFEKVGFKNTKTEDILSAEIKKEGFIGKNVVLESGANKAIHSAQKVDEHGNPKEGFVKFEAAQKPMEKKDKWAEKMKKKGEKLHKKSEKVIEKGSVEKRLEKKKIKMENKENKWVQKMKKKGEKLHKKSDDVLRRE